MSKVALSGNASGTGTLTIAAPNTNTDRTLTLPDAAGTMFNQGNIVGTVSESSGVPTGAIIEQGSNANGEYVKYADGTVLMYIRGVESRAASGNLATTKTLPVALAVDIDTYGVVTPTIYSTSPATFSCITYGASTTTTVTTYINRLNTNNTTFYVMIVGRWF